MLRFLKTHTGNRDTPGKLSSLFLTFTIYFVSEQGNRFELHVPGSIF